MSPYGATTLLMAVRQVVAVRDVRDLPELFLQCLCKSLAQIFCRVVPVFPQGTDYIINCRSSCLALGDGIPARPYSATFITDSRYRFK